MRLIVQIICLVLAQAAVFALVWFWLDWDAIEAAIDLSPAPKYVPTWRDTCPKCGRSGYIKIVEDSGGEEWICGHGACFYKWRPGDEDCSLEGETP